MTARTKKRPSLGAKIALALAGLAIAASATGLALLRTRQETAPHIQQIERITFQQASKSPEIRQAYLSQIAQELKLPANSASVIYDPQKKLLRELLETYQVPSVTITGNAQTYSIHTETIPYKPGELDKLSALNDEKRVMITCKKVLLYATGQNATIHAFEDSFSRILQEPPELQEIYMRSILQHEILHAKDQHSGFNIGDKLIDNDMALILLATKLLEPIGEARAYGLQYKYLVEKTGQSRKNIEENYVKHVRTIEKLKPNVPAHIGHHDMMRLIDSFLEEQYKDSILGKLLN